MHSKPTPHHSGVAKIVEKQMRNWEIAHAQHIDASSPSRLDVQEFVSMSNAVGAGGGEIAALLSQKLNWPIFHKEILLAMAKDDNVRAQLYRSLDERDLSWFEEAFRSLAQEEFKKNDYFHRLTETVLVLARRGHAIFLGRATDLILPRHRGIRVKIIASEEYRIEQFAKYSHIGLDEARTAVARIEQERAKFFRHRFPGRDDDHKRFDLMISSQYFTTEQATSLILKAMRFRGIIE